MEELSNFASQTQSLTIPNDPAEKDSDSESLDDIERSLTESTEDIVEPLFKAKWEADTEKNRSKLMKSIYLERVDVVEKLMKKGVDTNFTGECGWTPLKIAVDKKNLPLVKLILTRSSTTDVNQRDEILNTPLMRAIKLPHYNDEEKKNVLTIVRLLLAFPGIDVNVQDCVGTTALLFAVANRDLETVGELLKAGASPNLANDQGITPLHAAVINKDQFMVELLLEYGGWLQKDYIGKSPLDYATPEIKGFIESESPPPIVNTITLTKYRPLSKKQQLGMTSIGTQSPNQQPWLARDLRVLKHYGCNVLVTLSDTTELASRGIGDLFHQLPKFNIESIHFPIQKTIVLPWTMPPVDDLIALTNKIISLLREDSVVIIHSGSGKSRCGLLAAAILMQIGYCENEAIGIINAIDSTLLNHVYLVYLSTVSSKISDTRNEKNRKLFTKIKIEKTEVDPGNYIPYI